MYRVITMSAPLYKDHDKTQKKGRVEGEVTFESEKWDKDSEGNPMVKTASVEYVPQGSTVITNGDGWVKGSDVQKIEVDVDPGPQPGEDPAPIDTISDAELGYAVRVVLNEVGKAFRGVF
jgi:hypothetical protein